MPLSKARNAARMRNARAIATGVQPNATALVQPLSPGQRKYRLAELIATPISPDKINASHIISAIDIYNKMDKIYSEAPQFTDNRQITVVVSSEKAKELTEGVGAFDIFSKGEE